MLLSPEEIENRSRRRNSCFLLFVLFQFRCLQSLRESKREHWFYISLQNTDIQRVPPLVHLPKSLVAAQSTECLYVSPSTATVVR